MEEGDGSDEWTDSPNVCSLGRFQVSPTVESGKVVLFSIPMHNGYAPVLDGGISAKGFIDYLLNEEFAE